MATHHRWEQGMPITCGQPHGVVTSVISDVGCPACIREIMTSESLNEITKIMVKHTSNALARSIEEGNWMKAAIESNELDTYIRYICLMNARLNDL